MQDTREKFLSLETFMRKNEYDFFGFLKIYTYHHKMDYIEAFMNVRRADISDAFRNRSSNMLAREILAPVVDYFKADGDVSWAAIQDHWRLYLEVHGERDALWDRTLLNEVEIFTVDSMPPEVNNISENLAGVVSFDENLL